MKLFRTYFKDTLNERWLRTYEGQRTQGLETFSVKNVPVDVTDEIVQAKLNQGGSTLNLHRGPVNPSRAIETGWMEWKELNA
jgi:hypothetical protein